MTQNCFIIALCESVFPVLPHKHTMMKLPEEITRSPVASQCRIKKYTTHFRNAYMECRLDVTWAALKDANFRVSLIYSNFCRDEKGDRKTVFHAHPALLSRTHQLMPFTKNQVIFLTSFEDVLERHSHLYPTPFFWSTQQGNTGRIY